MDLHVDIHDGNGPPLLLVHGFLSSRAQWMQNLAALASVVTPVTVELLGHGRSPAPQDVQCYAPDAYIAAFERIREGLGVERWALCGYSLGAGLTFRYALTHPERVLCHVFTNSTSGFSEHRGDVDREAIVRRFEAGGAAMIHDVPVHPRFAKKLPAVVRDALCADAALLDPGGVARTIAYTNSDATVRDRVHENTRPALLVCGASEPRFQPLREFIATAGRHIEITDVPAGHAVNAEDPDAFNMIVTRFLARHVGC